MVLFWLHTSIDILLFVLYLTLSLILFLTFQRAGIAKISELFPNVWILSGLFLLFRGLQKGFEVLIQFSLISVEASIMEIVFKTVILTILVLLLFVIRDNYQYIKLISKTIESVRSRDN